MPRANHPIPTREIVTVESCLFSEMEDNYEELFAAANNNTAAAEDDANFWEPERDHLFFRDVNEDRSLTDIEDYESTNCLDEGVNYMFD